MIHEGTAVLLGYDDHVTGCVLFSFYLFPVTKRLSVSKSSVCSYNHNYTNRPIWPLCNLNSTTGHNVLYLPLIEKANGKTIGDTNKLIWTSISNPEYFKRKRA